MIAAKAREANEEKTEKRKLCLMVLILHHLQGFGYTDSVARLEAESSVSLRKFTAADNVELLTVLQEFETFHTIKFGKPPRLVRKIGDAAAAPAAAPKRRTPPPQPSARYKPPPHSAGGGDAPAYAVAAEKASPASARPPPPPHDKTRPPPATAAAGKPDAVAPPHGHRLPSLPPQPPPPAPTEKAVDLGVTGTKVLIAGGVGRGGSETRPLNVYSPQGRMRSNATALDDQEPPAPPSSSLYDNKLLKPLLHYENSELRELAAIITRDIYMENPNVRWFDIAGLHESKRLVREAIVYPLRFPELFTGILSPWKGILLYGPPGTGKTMLAKAVATECKTTFFNISASSIVSKWRGDSEKLVRVLFELARYHSPSTIFIDEIEAIMGHRTSDGQEHEGSRRMKTELLIQILIGLPDVLARRSMFEMNLPQGAVDAFGRPLVGTLDYQALAESSEGYSGSDIKLVCKEAAMRPLRRLFAEAEAEEAAAAAASADAEKEKSGDAGPGRRRGRAAAGNGSALHQAAAADAATAAAAEREQPLPFRREPVSMDDCVEALRATRPSSSSVQNEKYVGWQDAFGSV
ncbi:P-loop containing nucleoside triphosphate hydrolase protein [Zopfochytrium polystomum]|nr:P-loop containing nucleoside triphosphate hydrolase protein [Zopfochytrium polystomum]